MKASLVIMAAGLGSRYGGSKQVDGLGPDGETLMEYSVYDAIRAGFSKVVFVVKPEMRERIEALCGARVARMTAADGSRVEVAYAYQDLTCVPDWYRVPAERVKPFGTAHAALCARTAAHEPFVLINADDYYGVDAFAAMYRALCDLPATNAAAMVGYRVDRTISDRGTVPRGVCHTENGRLTKIVEMFGIARDDDGVIRARESGTALAPETPVSMNFWGFTPWIFEKLDAFFDEFLKRLAPDDAKSEAMLPTLIDELLDRGELTVSVLPCDARWFGVTYREDKPSVQAELKKLHDAGVYPPSLRV